MVRCFFNQVLKTKLFVIYITLIILKVKKSGLISHRKENFPDNNMVIQVIVIYIILFPFFQSLLKLNFQLVEQEQGAAAATPCSTQAPYSLSTFLHKLNLKYKTAKTDRIS
jgi:hypothetical protein